MPTLLLNTDTIELLPAPLLRTRGNADARQLAQATWLLRRKRDGRYLATANPHGLRALVPRLMHEPGIEAALDRLDALPAPSKRIPTETTWLPLTALQQRLTGLGLKAEDYAQRTGLTLQPEPSSLHAAGRDRYARALWLSAGAARAWRALRYAAAHDGIVLEAISGYRSHDYQLGIFARKAARGLSLAQILAVNAAPGFSEHHSGHALDIGTPGEPPAEESFEHTHAFAWLRAHASTFGYRMSYPRNNPHGIVYEPWHWCWQDTSSA